MMTFLLYLTSLLGLIGLELVSCEVIPVFTAPKGRTFLSNDTDGGYYRSILIDDSTQTAYIGARNNIYKISLSSSGVEKTTPKSNLQIRPNFGKAETEVDTDWNPESDTYKHVHDYITKHYANSLPATESLSQVYKLKNHTFEAQCRRQLRILRLYYGDHLHLPIDNADVICASHNKGLTWLNKGRGQLFSVRNGVFGTMPVGLTGVTDYERGYPLWYQEAVSLTAPSVGNDARIDQVNRITEEEWYGVVRQKNRTCARCNYSQDEDECMYIDSSGKQVLCFRETPIPNYMSTNYLCDPTPNPSRVIVDTNNMVISKEGPIAATARDSCPGTNLASTLISGFHPDQASKTITSDSGNGANRGAAIYILSEIGQEKQLDVNHEAFMGYEEPIPITGSASLALVRMNVQANGDISNNDIVVSNPFKETWVTSPLTKYGRLVKTGNQATVPHRPRAVALFEDGDFVYFFFREVGWESMILPEYSVNRYHYLWKVYDRAMSYPWEAPRPASQSYMNQFERSSRNFIFEYSNREIFEGMEKTFNEHVYAPRLEAFKQGWDSAKMVSRVGRVCKRDTGLPLGTQDASLFNIDNRLSLSAFQTYLKSTLTCSVKVKATPRIWRLRRDRDSLLRQNLLEVTNNCTKWKCYDEYNTCAFSAEDPEPKYIQENTGVFCAANRQGRDLSFRAFYDYYTSYSDTFNPKGLFQYTLSGFSQTHWSYDRHMPSFSSVTYQYTELQDLYKVGDSIYGLFSSPMATEGVEIGDSELPAASAVCQFSMDDISQAFNGPFMKRMNNAWRPYDPRLEGDNITPSPYSCDADPIEQEARSIEDMEIEFTDESLPLEEELMNFDMRSKSSRLNFFEKDVEGSRTMWKAVQAEPILVSKEVKYEKIQAEKLTGRLSDISILYLVTASGEIQKVSTWRRDNSGERKCWKGNGTDLEKWWREETNLRNNSWGEDYFTLTQENETRGGDDYMFSADWDCDSTVNEYKILAIYKPFGDIKTKIWDIQLAGDQLVVGTDTQVKTIQTAQCEQYLHCSTCSRDPHCGWDPKTTLCKTYRSGLEQSVKSPANCSVCLLKKKEFDVNENVLLHTTLGQQELKSIDQFNWYHNNTKVDEQFGRFIMTRNSSLYVIKARPEDAGTWQLRDNSKQRTGTCMVTYNLTLSDCITEECLYDKQTAQWCTEHETWQNLMWEWEKNMIQSGCSNVDQSAEEP